MLGDNLAYIKDIASLVTSIIVALVAITGLNTWRRQLIGNTEYEHARQLLKVVYRVREAIRLVRNPFVSPSESAAAIKDSEIKIEIENIIDTETQKKINAAVYQQRWKKLAETLLDFELETFEAEAIWDAEIVNLLKELRIEIGELHWAVGMLLNPPKKFNPELQQRIDDVVYSWDDLNNSETENAFSKS